MAEFKVKVGTETVRCWFMVGTLCVCWKGSNYMIEPDEQGWKQKVGKLDDKTVQLIGKAVEKYIKDHH